MSKVFLVIFELLAIAHMAVLYIIILFYSTIYGWQDLSNSFVMHQFVQCLVVMMQLCKAQYAHSEHGHGWDIRHSVPGEPGQDYPILARIPKTSFSCAGKEAGYYADIETRCQVFRVCTLDSTFGFQSFLCPNGTIFNQKVAVCDWWMNAKCDNAEEFYNNNIEKFNRLRFGPQMMSDVEKMLTHTLKKPYNNLKTDPNYTQKYKLPTRQSFQNGALSEDSHIAPDKIYVPQKHIETTYDIPKYDRINDNIVSSSTSKPHYHSKPSVSHVVEQKKQYANSQKRGPTNSNYTPKNSQKAKLIDNSSIVDTVSEQNHDRHLYPETINAHINKIPQPNTYRSQTHNINRHNNNIVGKQLSRVMNRGYKYFSDKNNLNVKFSDKLQSTIISAVDTKSMSPNGQNPNPMSHVIFKNWVLTPTENSKFILEPTPYIYSTPKSIPSPAKLITKSSGYIYNIPTSRPKSQKILSQQGYTYNKPHSSSKNSFPKLRSTPVPFRSTIPSKLYLEPANVKPTEPAQLHITPIEKVSTHNLRLYIPPSATSEPLPKLYLPSKSKIIVTQSEKLLGSPTSPTPVYLPPNNPLLTNANQSITLTNSDNLTFTDILTKNKLDLTVKSIVTDTHQILTSSNRLTHTHPNKENSDTNYDFHFQNNVKNGGQLKGFQYFASPSMELQPPIDTMHLTKHNSNQLVALPYFKELNTDHNETPERTVSLKFSLPEETVAYLFQNKKNGDFDKLEILNTGMDNYLVLTDDKIYSNISGSIFIPLGKLTLGENMVDSMNSIKEYQNYRKQQQNANNEDVSYIANKISDLTSSQFAENQIENKDEILDRQINFRENSEKKYSLQHSNEIYNTNFPNYNNNLNSNIQFDLMKPKLYSGELYGYSVPDVSNLLLNEESQNQNSFESNKQHTEVGDLEQGVQEGNFQDPTDFEEKSSSETEIIKSDNQSPASQQPARLQIAPSVNSDINFNEQHGISTTKSINSKPSFTNENTIESLNSREIEIRFIPSISFRVDKKKDLNKLLYEYLLEPKKLDQSKVENFSTNNRQNKYYKNDRITSEIDYTVNHPVNGHDTKAGYKVPESTYIGPSSYSVSQASIGLLEPQQIQKIRPNHSLGFSNYESSRLEHMDENNGYSKVSPLPPFSF